MDRVTPGFFAMLGVQPVVGHFFTPENNRPGNDQVVVLAYDFWVAHFGADPDIVGRQVTLEQRPCTIVGVAPASVGYFAPTPALYIPESWSPNWLDALSRLTRSPRLRGQLFARLRPDVSLQQAAARIAAIDRAYYDSASAAYQRHADQTGAVSVVRSLRDEHGAAQRGTLHLLQGAAVFVLLIGCVNVASLLLARAAARRTEFAIRHALGGGRRRIAGLLFGEAVLLSLLGGLLGTGLSLLEGWMLNRQAFGVLGIYGAHFSLSTSTLVFAVDLSVLVGLVIGAFPAVRLLRGGLLDGLKQYSPNASRSRRGRVFGSALAAGQITLSFVLLVGAGLMTRSLMRALAVPPGFDTADVTVVRIAIPPVWFRDITKVYTLEDRIVAALKSIAGVEAVGYASDTPMHSRYILASLYIKGRGSETSSSHPLVGRISVSPGYFQALDIPLLRGRDFDARDDAKGVRSVIIDRRLAERFFPGENPVGRRIALNRLPSSDNRWWTVVGVAETARYNGLDDTK